MYKFARHVSLRPVTLDDAGFIVGLRNDVKKNIFISESVSTLTEQEGWITDYLLRNQAEQELYFIIEGMDQQSLGTVRLYDYQGESFCWGSWILRDGSPAYAAIESALSVYEYAFHTVNFNQSHFDVRKENTKVVDFHLRMGASIVDQSDSDFFFKFHESDYQKIRKKYKKFLA